MQPGCATNKPACSTLFVRERALRKPLRKMLSRTHFLHKYFFLCFGERESILSARARISNKDLLYHRMTSTVEGTWPELS